MTDTGDLWDGPNPSAVITEVSCCSSSLEVNREYHTLFVCLSKSKKYLLEMNNNQLLIAVSRKPVSHFPHTIQLKVQRGCCT